MIKADYDLKAAWKNNQHKVPQRSYMYIFLTFSTLHSNKQR